MPLSSFFSWPFSSPQSTAHCTPSHQQRHQNQKLSQQMQALDPESIRKQHGKLDSRYEQVIEEASIQSVYRVEKYMKQFRQLLEKVDNYCAQNTARKYGDKLECVQEMDGLILERFQKPFITSQLNLYKTANLCLIQGQALNECIERVKRENFESLQKNLKSLQQLVRDKCN